MDVYFINLGINILVTVCVWRYYRTRTFPTTSRYSTFGPRFWSWFVDDCVLTPVFLITWALFYLNLPRWLAALLVIVQYLIGTVYTVVMQGRYGQTVGKMVTKVRVVNFRTGGKISYGQALLRESVPAVLGLGSMGADVFHVLMGGASTRAIVQGDDTSFKPSWLLTAIPFFWFLVEILTMLTNKKRRALHDFIAGTVVIRTNLDESTVETSAAPGQVVPQPG